MDMVNTGTLNNYFHVIIINIYVQFCEYETYVRQIDEHLYNNLEKPPLST